jgi:hypothetical protein
LIPVANHFNSLRTSRNEGKNTTRTYLWSSYYKTKQNKLLWV